MVTVFSLSPSTSPFVLFPLSPLSSPLLSLSLSIPTLSLFTQHYFSCQHNFPSLHHSDLGLSVLAVRPRGPYLSWFPQLSTGLIKITQTMVFLSAFLLDPYGSPLEADSLLIPLVSLHFHHLMISGHSIMWPLRPVRFVNHSCLTG